MLKRLISSLLLGTSIGVSPYAVATSLPSAGLKKAQGENAGFGKRCLLDKEICDFLSETKFKQDEEKGKPIIQSGDENNSVEKDYAEQWNNFLKPRGDDYCGFGFLGYKENKNNPPKINVNNLETCHKTVLENIKKQMAEKEKAKQQQAKSK